MRDQSSSVMVSKGFSWAMAALLTRMPTAPNSAATAARAARTLARSSIRMATGSARPPACRISAATSRALSALVS